LKVDLSSNFNIDGINNVTKNHLEETGSQVINLNNLSYTTNPSLTSQHNEINTKLDAFKTTSEDLLKLMKGNISLYFLYFSINKQKECLVVALQYLSTNKSKANEFMHEYHKCSTSLNSL